MTQSGICPHARSLDNAQDLRNDERREQFMLLSLTGPALLLVALVALLPIVMLVYLSFQDDSGGFTLANYARLFQGPTYYRVFYTTFTIAIITTFVCALLAVPLAYMLSTLPRRIANVLMILVLVPLWTSVLVRTYAWLAILQRNGLINTIGMHLHLWDAPLTLSFNWIGTLIGTIHVMLPYMILPIYSSMRKVDGSLIQASEGLGASPVTTFWRVFFPLVRPGVLAGCLIVFVLCLGFYVVPALMGGGRVPMISIQTANDVELFYNWGSAGALGVLLLIVTLALLFVANRFLPSNTLSDTSNH